MGDYRHVGFIFVFVYLNRFYFPQSLACNVEINDFHRFGPTCEHLCHCVGNKMCNDTTGVCDECEDPWFGPACQYYDIAFQFIDKKKAYGSRHLDNIKPHKYADLAQDGNFSTCSSTNISSAGNRAIPPFWSIYFINNTRFNDIQLVLSENETLRAYFNGYKIYIENLTSWGYQIKDRNYLPPNTSRSLCYQHNGSQITDRTMVVQCGKTLIGNSVRIEMANKDTQLVLCDIKISAGRNMAFGKGLTPSPNNIQSSYSSTGSFDGNTDTICSGMYGHDSQPEWIQVDLMHQVELNLIVITGYQTVCNKTTWGEECKKKCGHCINGDSCNVSNGHCTACASGYKPTTTCEDECDPGMYGFNCFQKCGQCRLALDCDKVSGMCSEGCDAGWNGTRCDQASSSGSVIGGSVVVVIVIAVGIVISVIFIRRRKAKPIKRRKAKSPYANGTEDDQSGMNMDGENIVYINTDAVQQTSTAHDDHSRVVIQTEMSYINACFIKGFQKTISYVASQGPMESNMEDFWQMIWEQNIQTVVMVTNLVEETKMKCLQYWGEGLKHQTTYGNFEVTLMKEEVFADFCIRTVGFHRTIHPSERRKLTQFHYTSWPDKDVPQSPISLIHFWRKGQYRLLHRLMLELFVLPFEPVRNELFDNTFREMSRVAHKSKSRKSRLRLQYEDLDKGLEMDSVDDDIACTTALLPDNYSKNRFDHILSADEYRPFLRSQCQGRNNYINAVFMPSYTNPKGFIISQMPLPSTAVDVCRLIIDEEINLVVQFDDSGKEEIGRFLPENEEKMKIDAFEVRRTRTFKHILFKKWTRNRLVPPDSSSLLNLVKEVEGQQSPEDNWDSPILVLCFGINI
ncbi:PTPRA-like protein [Mya arenaria]|uniref:PTPRA-like protein n=1 Tax=Mya arenaria TaxID=6604 RepID=A0ABY7DKS1_MYAAR|nr:PTPRA-like protein [Mya arenaria]